MLWEHCLVKTNIIEVQISLYCLHCLHISSTFHTTLISIFSFSVSSVLSCVFAVLKEGRTVGHISKEFSKVLLRVEEQRVKLLEIKLRKQKKE